MLIITRKVGEQLVINNDIIVQVMEIRDDGSRVRIGVDAPITVSVHRREVADAIKRQNEERTKQ